jgi:hypothetical protein
MHLLDCRPDLALGSSAGRGVQPFWAREDGMNCYKHAAAALDPPIDSDFAAAGSVAPRTLLRTVKQFSCVLRHISRALAQTLSHVQLSGLTHVYPKGATPESICHCVRVRSSRARTSSRYPSRAAP